MKGDFTFRFRLAVQVAGGDTPTIIAANVEMETGGPQTLQEVQAAHIRQTLAETGNHITKTADILGINRSTLWSQMQRYGIERTKALPAPPKDTPRPLPLPEGRCHDK